MIVKVQVPLANNDPSAPAFIYDRARKYQGLVPVDETILGLMSGRPKAFFHAEYDDKTGKIRITREAAWQEW